MCFSLSWIEGLLIDCVIIAAVVAILRLLVPWVLNQMGAGGGVIMQMLNIVIWAIVVIFAIYVGFGLLGCLGGGFSFHRLG